MSSSINTVNCKYMKTIAEAFNCKLSEEEINQVYSNVSKYRCQFQQELAVCMSMEDKDACYFPSLWNEKRCSSRLENFHIEGDALIDLLKRRCFKKVSKKKDAYFKSFDNDDVIQVQKMLEKSRCSKEFNKKCPCLSRDQHENYLFLYSKREGNCGSFHINSRDIYKFMDHFCRVIQAGFGHVFSLVEAQSDSDHSHVCIDFDIKEEGLELKEIVTNTEIDEIVHLFQDVIERYVNPIHDQGKKWRQRDCIILTKPPRLENGLLKNGFHLQFPNLNLSSPQRRNLHIILRHEFYARYTRFAKNAFDDCYKMSWLLYGLMKDEKSLFYKADRVIMQDKQVLHPMDYYIGKQVRILKEVTKEQDQALCQARLQAQEQEDARFEALCQGNELPQADQAQENAFIQTFQMRDINEEGKAFTRFFHSDYITLQNRTQVEFNLPKLLLLHNYFLANRQEQAQCLPYSCLKSKVGNVNMEAYIEQISEQKKKTNYNCLEKTDMNLSHEDLSNIDAMVKDALIRSEIAGYFEPDRCGFKGNFLALKRIKKGPCFLDPSILHETRPAYISVDCKHNLLWLGCHNGCVTNEGKKGICLGKFRESIDEEPIKIFEKFEEVLNDDECFFSQDLSDNVDKLQALTQPILKHFYLTNKTTDYSISLALREREYSDQLMRCFCSNKRHVYDEPKKYPYLFISQSTGLLFVYCTICERSKLLGKYNSIYDNNEEFNEDFNINGKRLIDNLFQTKVKPEIVHEQFVKVEHLMNPAKCVVVKSNLGSGKTTSSIKYIDSLAQDVPIVFMTPRRSYARSFHQRVNSENKSGRTFALYLDEKVPIIQKTNIIIQAESLHRLNIDFSGCVVIIDEVESFLGQLTSTTTHQHHIRSVNVLDEMLTSAQKILMFDAFISSKTINFCMDYELETKYFEYKFASVTRNIIRCAGKTTNPSEIEVVKRRTDNSDYFIASLLQDLKNGKRIYLFSSSNKFLLNIEEIIKRELSSLKYLIYHSGSSNKVVNCQEEWSNVDLVMTTSTITVGVNFDVEDHFDRGYVYVSACSANLVRDIYQSLYRVRHYKENFFVLCMDELPIGCNMKTHPIDIKQISEHVEFVQSEIMQNYKRADLAPPLWLKKLFIQNTLERNLCVHHLNTFFNIMAEMSGYKFSSTDLVVDNVTSNLTGEEFLEWLEKKNAEMEIKDHTLDYANIPYEKNSQALEELKSKKLKGIPLTDLEKLTLLKSVFKSFYIRPDLTYEQEHFIWLLFIDAKYTRNKVKLIRSEKIARQTSDTSLFINETKHAIFQEKFNVQIKHVLKMTEMLNLPHSQATTSTVTRENMLKYGEYLSSNGEDFTALKNAFQITLEGDLKNVKYIACIINQVLNNIGYSELKTGPRVQKRIDGKRVTVSDFIVESEFKMTEKKYAKLIENYIEKGVEIDIYKMMYSSDDREEDRARARNDQMRD